MLDSTHSGIFILPAISRPRACITEAPQNDISRHSSQQILSSFTAPGTRRGSAE